MDYAKFENFQEFYDAVEMGLDIEFFIDGIRYNISWQNNKPFICVCPDGEPNYYSDTQDLLDNHKIDGVPIKDCGKILIYMQCKMVRIMKELELIAEYETSFGKILLVKSCETLKVGENILVKDKIYKIKRIILPTRPTQNDVISILV